MIVAKYGNYVRKFMWQLCEWGRVHIARSNEILGWEGVGNRQLLCFLKRRLIGAC
jgi:hypothetical protein